MIIRKTSPAARIATGAKYGSSVLKLPLVANWSRVTEKYRIVRTVITITLPSRSVRKRLTRVHAPEARARLVAGPFSVVSVGGGWLPVSTATGQLLVTPADDDVPSNRDFVLL